MRTLDQVIAKLPAVRRRKIAARAQELVAEENALRQLRKARDLTQDRMAKLLGVGQDSVSRLESRSDLLLSTLRGYVEAMGGTLKLVVEFPDSTAILSSLGEVAPEQSSHARKPSRRKARARA